MDKKPWQSKTVWFAFFSALVAFISAFWAPLGDFIAKNPEIPMYVMSAVFVLLRLASKGKIVIE